ncbi:MAG TPA: efflux RND transporter permease subunit [Fibrobacteria bacterium]|nr:efflux RND transporter permease subunit [Fibrobacteria bacterium]
MSLSSTAIRRPVLSIVLNLVIVLFGLVALSFLGVRDYPAVDPPIVSVQTGYPGANAEVIESQITEPLEESINSVPGIRSITSTSRDGRSSITVEFVLGTDLEAAANDVRDKVSRAMRNLPPDADNPAISKADADASPILFLNVTSETRNHLDMTALANDVFKERLQTIPGVSEVRIWGEKNYAMRLWLDPHRMASRGVTPLDVREALDRENVELPSGSVEGDRTELTVRAVSRLPDAEAFNNVIIREEGGQAIRLRDVGRAEIGAENPRQSMKTDGLPTVGVVLIPQPGANHIAIADEFHARLEAIKKDLPADVKVAIGFDTTRFIRKSLLEVGETIAIALALVCLILFAFFRNWRTTLIPILAIPISLLSAFFIMYLSGFSVNILTLLALVLATGLVVDDAIVVLENIYTKIEKGMDPKEAGHKGSAEILFAIVSTTITLAAVFLPIIFLQGTTGRLFREFGVVVAGSVLVSAFVSLTLTPMLCTRLPRGGGHGSFHRRTEPFFERMTEGYRDTLRGFLRRRWLVFPVMAVSLVLIGVLFKSLPSELAPLEDKGRLNINATAQEGATFDFMDQFMDRLAPMVQEEVPEAATIISRASPGGGGSGGTTRGRLEVILADRHERERSQQEIASVLMRKMRTITDARVSVSQEQTIGGRRGGDPVQFVLQNPDFAKLREHLPRFLERAAREPALQNVDVDLKFTKPELRLEIDRDKARALGISAADIARTLQFSLSESRYGYFIMNGKQYSVIGQMDRADRDAPADLKAIHVRARNGALVQLENLITLSESSSPPQLYRYNRFSSATVSAALADGSTIADGIAAMEAAAAEVLDETFTTALAGPARDFSESSSTLLFAFLFALVLIYMVLAAQFESFRDPLIVMVTVPLAFAGALLTLWYFRQTLNIFSQIGIIMLIGLVTKNGILIVEFVNQKLEQGLPLGEALVEGAVSRFRPIIMTSLATGLGALPIALALGAGAESRVSMGIAVIGGVLFSLVLTLYVIPALCSYLSRPKPGISGPDHGAFAEGTPRTSRESKGSMKTLAERIQEA